jgi:3-dehydroquinate synthase
VSEPILVKARAGDYRVHLGPGLLGDLGRILTSEGIRGRLALVSDPDVRAHFGATARGSLTAASFVVHDFDLPPGERAKTMQVAESVCSQLIGNGFTREDCIVALGGGSVGDLAGFVAATYHRGVPLVQVPTTVLAQVDSSIGGKVAVDHPMGKNLIGAFHPPRVVVSDTDTLATLPRRQRWSGLAEVVKVALIADAAFFSSLETELVDFGEGALSAGVVARIVEQAARIKVGVVSEDERESGRRLTLNFGHTIGHAIEATAGYCRLTHGEAVVAGMKGAIAISAQLGALPHEAATRASKLLGRFPLAADVGPLDRASVLATALRDKKADASGLRFIILNAIGQAELTSSLPTRLLEAGIDVALSSLASRPA